jgi:hypothetical protein
MPRTRRFGALLAVAATVAALGGCGSNDVKGQLTPQQAAELNADLQDVQQATGSSDCTTAASSVRRFREHVFELPMEAGADLKDALQDSGKQLASLVAQQCGTSSGVTGFTGTQPTATPPKRTTTPGTTASSTTSTSSTTTTPSSESPSPPGEGNGNGLGNGNGAGNGNGQGSGSGSGNPGAGSPGGGNRGGGSTGGTGGTGGTGVGGG